MPPGPGRRADLAAKNEIDGAQDTQCRPQIIAVKTAEVTDRKGALLALGRCAADLHAVQGILADGRYVGPPFAEAVKELLGAEVQIAKRSELLPLPSYHSARWSSAHSPGSRNTAVSGKIASANSTPACSSSISPS